MFCNSQGKISVKAVGAGRVYVLRLELPDNLIVHKIGMTHSPRSADRMMEILRSWFMQYRYVPRTELRLDKETGVPRLLEKHMHTILAEWKWVPDKKVDGGQEMFTGLDEEVVLDYLKNFDYQDLLVNCTSIATVDYDYIQTQLPPKPVETFDEDIPQ